MSHSHYRKGSNSGSFVNGPTAYASIAAQAVASATKAAQSGTFATNPYPKNDVRSSYEGANNNGGYSFDQCAATKFAINNGDMASARRIAEEYLIKVATIGTNESVVQCSAQKLTTTAINFVNYLIQNGMANIIIDVVGKVYNGSRAKNLDHSMFLLALCTTVPDSISGSPDKTAEIRRLGYSFISELRTGSHFLMWVSTHIGICKARKSKGTGAGFRNACKSWFLKQSAKDLQYQVVKYGNRSGFTMKDVLSLTHIKATSKHRNASKKSGSSKVVDYLTADIQFVLACVVNGFNAALTELDEIAGRKFKSIQTMNVESSAFIAREMEDALECVAYEAAVRIAKTESSSLDDVIKMINVFGVTHEMVNNSFMKDKSVLATLTSRTIPNGVESLAVKVELMTPHIANLENLAPFFAAFKEGRRFVLETPNAVTIEQTAISTSLNLEDMLERELRDAMTELVEPTEPTTPTLNVNDSIVQVKKTTYQNEPRITMPYTALIRFLNRLTTANLFDRVSFPRAPQLLQILENYLVDPVVVSRSRIHPMAIFTALATYQKGSGIKGSLTWTPNKNVINALENAIRVSFQNCKPHGKIVAHLIDASASMTWPGSTSIPDVIARDLVSFLVGISMEIEDISRNPEKIYAGYFTGYVYENKQPYVEITNDLKKKTSLSEVKNLFSTINAGGTNMQVAFDYYRNMLESSLQRARDGDRAYSHIKSALQLPGFIEIFQLWTDNDVNGGQKVPECLNAYYRVQRAACAAFPRRLDGTECDPDQLFRQHCAKLVVVCTLASQFVVGDPFDSRVLCISGFDSSGPQLITNFIEDWDIRSGLVETIDVGDIDNSNVDQ